MPNHGASQPEMWSPAPRVNPPFANAERHAMTSNQTRIAVARSRTVRTARRAPLTRASDTWLADRSRPTDTVLGIAVAILIAQAGLCFGASSRPGATLDAGAQSVPFCQPRLLTYRVSVSDPAPPSSFSMHTTARSSSLAWHGRRHFARGPRAQRLPRAARELCDEPCRASSYVLSPTRGNSACDRSARALADVHVPCTARELHSPMRNPSRSTDRAR